MKKKWIIVGLILVLVIGVAVYLIAQGSKTDEEKTAEELFPKIEDISSAPDLKYIEPEEAKGKLQVEAQLNKEHWEQLRTLSIEVRIKNKTDQLLLRAVVIHTIIDKSGNAIVRNAYGVGSEVTNVGPGEVGTANLEMLISGSSLKGIDRVEYSLRDIGFASPPAQIEEPEQKEEPEQVEEPKETAPPSMTPEEVVRKWYDLMKKGKFSEAIELYTPDRRGEIESLGGAKAFEEEWQKRSVIRLEIERTEVDEFGTSVDVIFDWSDGVTEDHSDFNFVKINGQWKIEDESFWRHVRRGKSM